MSEYSLFDQARFLDEPAKRKGRTEFARDRARLIHSWALRRLGSKTQVVSPGIQDFPRTRLTHSLECAQIGRELGGILGADPDLMEAACLAHDIGHPPFGHNGEEALNEIAQSYGGFEGNAQSFRLLTRIEAKSVDQNGNSIGLNLTRATLDAATKYPWNRAAGLGKAAKETPSIKFGVYEEDLEIFNWMRQDAPFEAVSFEAQIMDFADDIAYSVHDLEDAIVAGSVKLDDLKNDLPTLHKDMSDSYLRGISLDEAAAALERLANLNYWPKSFGGTHRDLAGLKDLTSQLIGRFAIAAEDLTKEHYSGALTRFNANLMIPTEIKNEVAFLKSLTGFYIINHHRQQKNYQAQKLVLKEIANWISQNPQERISPFYLESFNSAANENAAKRVIIDQVASMTDFGAMDLFEKQIAKPGLG